MSIKSTTAILKPIESIKKITSKASLQAVITAYVEAGETMNKYKKAQEFARDLLREYANSTEHHGDKRLGGIDGGYVLSVSRTAARDDVFEEERFAQDYPKLYEEYCHGHKNEEMPKFRKVKA